MNKNYFVFGALTITANTAHFLLLLFFFVSFPFYSQTINKTLVQASSPLVVPAGILSLTVNCWGAGGGGGGSNFLSAAGGGGGGGSFKTGTVSVTPVAANAQISYTIGQGGTGGISTTMNGTDGGSTIFSTVTASGGTGGKGATSNGNYGAGGAGGVTSGGFSGGTGASAANVVIIGLSSGGGGGGAGSGSVGLAASGTTGGTGGTGSGGTGGSGRTLLGSGGDGADFGGGGGGGLTLLSLANSTGGKGGNGQITVSYTCPIYSIANNVTASDACVSSGTSTVTVSSSAAGLPIGTYTVVYDRSLPAGTNLEASMVVTVAGSGTFTADGLTTNGTSTITITKLKSVDCESTMSANNTANVSVSIFPGTPVLGTTTQPNCIVSTGSIILSGLPVSGTVYQTGTVPNSYSISNATGTMTISGLAAGNYTFSSASGLCLSSSTGNVVINSPVTKTWGGSSWSPAGEPSLDNAVIFSGNAVITSPLNACSCQINSGVSIVVGAALANNSNAVVTIQSGLNVQGTLTFENNSGLIQLNDNGVNSGSIIYKRTTSAVKDFDYVYWSSPVTGQTLGLLSPNSDKYWSYANGAWVSESTGSVMTAAKGFIARVPPSVSSQSVVFTGAPNNGSISITGQGVMKTNLIGNPYASAVDANLFIAGNISIISGPLYFWTHNTSRSLNNAGTKFVYTSDDYATYNFTGGVATAAAAKSTDINGDGIGDGSQPSGKIAAGQSFFVVSKIAGSFTFTNSMRVSASGSNSQFFRQANTVKKEKTETNRIWLNLTNDGGAFKQLLIGYITGATNDFDNLYDGVSRNGNAFIDFFSINNSENYTIQGRQLPFDEADEVPLGYKSTIAGAFEISIEKTDGVLTNHAVYLEDKTAGTIYDLTKGSYSFTTGIGEFKNRFVLRYTKSSLETDDFGRKRKGAAVLLENQQIKIDSFDQIMSSVKVYDLKGNLLYENNKVDKNEFRIDHITASNQLLIVAVQLENGKRISEKIIFKD
ncbi:T9SS sorting signal type C domain-containing protein [Flavobacterium sp. HJJ]|uniref:glycine-rich domain-containing protein n=1 Tax=Flavobacterium sp. HJJ TaxID=2783792 RepID=UPI00188A631F|nr:T9SS sorting signal type C domain-containing protein [Flavobacterium sp. HJJ]MBF4473535.1 T9SS sorting signal type C domain-containing protein [Flavobacterium sp. HJJ]